MRGDAFAASNHNIDCGCDDCLAWCWYDNESDCDGRMPSDAETIATLRAQLAAAEKERDEARAKYETAKEIGTKALAALHYNGERPANREAFDKAGWECADRWWHRWAEANEATERARRAARVWKALAKRHWKSPGRWVRCERCGADGYDIPFGGWSYTIVQADGVSYGPRRYTCRACHFASVEGSLRMATKRKAAAVEKAERAVIRAAMRWSNAIEGNQTARSALAIACMRLDDARRAAKRAARKAGR